MYTAVSIPNATELEINKQQKMKKYTAHTTIYKCFSKQVVSKRYKARMVRYLSVCDIENPAFKKSGECSPIAFGGRFRP